MAGIFAGSAFVRLGADVDERGFKDYEQRVARAQKHKDVETRLGAKVDEQDFKRYYDQLDKTQKRVARKEAFKASLGGDYHPGAFRAYERDLNKAERDTVQSSAKMRTAFGTVWGRGGAAFAAAGGAYALVRGVKSVTEAYADSQTSQAKMAAQLKALNISYGAHAKEIDQVIQKTSKLAGLDDEDLQDAFTAIVRSTGSVNTALKDMTLVADLARAKHIDVAAAGQMVARVHAGNVRVLKSLGLAFDASTTSVDNLKATTKKYTPEQLAAAKAADKTADSNRALELLQRRLAGQSEAYGKTQAGAADRVKVAWENLRETIGRRLAPTLTRAANHLADFLNQMQDGTGAGGRFVEKLKDARDVIGDVVGKLKDVGGFLLEHKRLIGLAAGAWAAYKTAAFASIAVSKLAGLAALAGGRSAAAGSAVGGAGAAGGAASRVGGVLGVVAGIAAFAGVEIALQNIERKAKKAAEGMRIGVNYAKQLAEQGDAAGVRKLAASIDDWGHKNGLAAGKVRDLKNAVGELTELAARNALPRAVRKMTQSFTELALDGGNSLSGIKRTTEDNLAVIRHTLGSETKAGKDAAAKNFRLAADAIKTSMENGKISTKTGLEEIRNLMGSTLSEFGVVLHKRSPTNVLAGGDPRGVYKAGGGWIGAPGEAGQDSVLAMLGPGEAVLNRHQQGPVEFALRSTFGVGLDDLFAKITRPHYLARGGKASDDASGMVAALQRFAAGGRLQLPDGFTPTHQTANLPGYPAKDIFASPGTAVLSPVDGTVARLSGQAGGPGGGGAYGYSIYINGANDRSYFLTHFGSRSVRAGQHVRRGQVIGTVADYPGGVPDHIHEGIHGGLTAVHGGDGGTAFSRIRAPRTGIRGTLGRIVQAGFNAATSAANSRIASLLGTTSPSGDTGGGQTSAGGRYDKAALMRLWVRAGGNPGVANIAAAIALAESRGDPNARNSIGATGLWQIYNGPNTSMGLKNPVANARAAVAKYNAAGGFTPWTVFTGADTPGHARTYLRYLARGGRVARGAPRVRSSGSQPTTGHDLTAGLRGQQTIRIGAYDALGSDIEHDQTRYGQQERRYNQSDEVFIDPATGELNQPAIEHRAGELAGLMKIRERILKRIEEQIRIAKRVVATYTTILRRLTRSLSHAKGKDRSGIREDIKKYTGERDTWRENLRALGDRRVDAQLDIGDLQKEGSELRGIVAEPATPDSLDTADTTPASNPDVDAIVAQFRQNTANAEANLRAANQVISAFGSSGDIGTGGSSAYAATANDARTAGTQPAAGAGGQGGVPQAPVGGNTYQFNMPGHPVILRAIGDAAVSGMGLQPAVSSSVEKLGI